MFKRNKLSAAILAATAAAHAPLAFGQLEEMVVTATKRAESAQDIAVTVQALNEEALERSGIATFDDYLLRLPNVTAGGAGPGQSTIYVRGVASSPPNLTTSGVAGLAPNVAFYLDEQPLAQPGRNLDIYAADMERLEVLPGPQGTLFGSSSQSGTIRMITNKPDPAGAYGSLKFGAGSIRDGESSHNFEGMINLPLSDKATLRAVGYTDTQGGWIDNVPGTQNLSESARFREANKTRDNGVQVGEDSKGFQAGADLSDVDFQDADNANLVDDDINETSYTGGRLSFRYDFSDDWRLFAAHTQQEVESDGVFYSDPDLEDFEVQRYESEFIDDEIQNTNLTLEGRFFGLDVIYAGSYTDRDTDQRVDYTDYLFVAQYLPFYICDTKVTYDGDARAGVDKNMTKPDGVCGPPNTFVDSVTGTEVATHEVRFSTDPESTIRATFGAFFSDTEVTERNDFTYPASADACPETARTLTDGVASQCTGTDEEKGFGPNFPYPTGYTSAGRYPAGVIFRNDVRRTEEQAALFGEITFDLGPSVTLTLGARAYENEVDLEGSAKGSFGNKGQTEDVDTSGTDISALYASGQDPDSHESDGTLGKLALSFEVGQDSMLYLTWSEGYRPGLLNRPGGRTTNKAVDADGNTVSYTVPHEVETDELTNIEFGWKVDTLGDTLRINGSLFMSEIERLQTTIFDTNIVNLYFSDNAADAEVLGLEGDVTWLPSWVPGLTVSGAFSFLDTEVTTVHLPTNRVVEGDELAYAPSFQANLSARYEWVVGGNKTAHIMPYVTHSGEVFTDIITINRHQLDAWTLLGVTAGVSTENWRAELYIDNLTDAAAQVSGNFINDRLRVNLAPPRTMGFRVSYDFGL